jgi:hypothetical protein
MFFTSDVNSLQFVCKRIAATFHLSFILQFKNQLDELFITAPWIGDNYALDIELDSFPKAGGEEEPGGRSNRG